MPPDYPYLIGREYPEPYRAQRITDLLRQRGGLTPDDMRRFQSDTYSLHAQALLPLLLRTVEHDRSGRPTRPGSAQIVELRRRR